MSNPERCKCGGLLHPNADDEEMLYCEKRGVPKNSSPPAVGEKPAIHELKTWPQYFEAVIAGTKTFELRKDDRRFKIGDTLKLREWNPESEEYTSRWCVCQVNYIAKGVFGLPEDMVILSIGQSPSSTESQPEQSKPEDEWPPRGMCSVVYPFDMGESLLCQRRLGHSGKHWAKGEHAEYSWPPEEPEQSKSPQGFEEWWNSEGDLVKWKKEPFKEIAEAAWNAAKAKGTK